MENELNLTLDHLVFCRLKDELLVNILVTINKPEKVHVDLIEILLGQGEGRGGEGGKGRVIDQYMDIGKSLVLFTTKNL